MQPPSEGPTSDFKNLGIWTKAGRLGKEFKHISAASPRLTIVAMVLFNEKLTRAGQSCVVISFISFVMRYTLVPKSFSEP